MLYLFVVHFWDVYSVFSSSFVLLTSRFWEGFQYYVFIYIFWLIYLILLQLFRPSLVYPLLTVLGLGLAYLLVGNIVGAITFEKSGCDKLVSEPQVRWSHLYRANA